MGPGRQLQDRLSGDGGGCGDSRFCQKLEIWSQAEVESTRFHQRAGGERRGSPEPRGQLSGLERNVARRPPGRPPAAALTLQLELIPAVWGQGRVWSQESQMWPVMPGGLCPGNKSSLYRAEKWVPAQTGLAGWDEVEMAMPPLYQSVCVALNKLRTLRALSPISGCDEHCMR